MYSKLLILIIFDIFTFDFVNQDFSIKDEPTINQSFELTFKKFKIPLFFI